ncbi:zinc finger CCCH-type antiviral protein 1-like [Tachysurus vachellii]|uniref:zinc finger CCCH-type antiviral protein 1-like n=1 Tax=Tachysurus vachellii TaxID=175792 RepID=UPI00296A9A99|nr:zinc finger CCCH-type antiviral protein 1-like [Tachysurus vachellii]
MNTSGKPYEWQLFDGQQWLQIQNDIIIECNYCQPGTKGITIDTDKGPLYIDYDAMTINALLSTTFDGLAVRRLLSLSHNQREDVGWYYKDNNSWCEYGLQGSSNSTSSINSRDIEQHYNSNPTSILGFITGKYKYNLNFSAMMETNLSTGKQRKVRRRPKFNSVIYVNNRCSTYNCDKNTRFNKNMNFLMNSTVLCLYFVYSLNIDPFTSTLNPSPSATHSANASTEAYGFYRQFTGDEGYQKPSSSLESSVIEREYQRNPQGQLAFRAGRYNYSLNFNSVYPINLTYERSSTLCQARWQFKDMNGHWNDFVKGTGRGKCNVSIQEIEMQYQQNTAGILIYSSDQFRYKLDFSEMTQTNLSTGKRRPVRRV